MNSCRKRVCVSAPAKLNLGLSIVGRRPNGYHEIESLFWPIDLCDEIELEPSTRLSIRMEWTSQENATGLPLLEDNILYKALQYFPSENLQITVQKKIPIGAGLGGGSSDAGALLRYLRSEMNVRNDALLEIATKLGADVPFFLNPVPSWVTGIGEKCTPIAGTPELYDRLHFLLVLAPFGMDTRKVFDRYRLENKTFSSKSGGPFREALDASGLKDILSNFHNGLEFAASAEKPLLKKILSKLRVTSALYAGLSGSGSTCFALFLSRDEAEKTAKELAHFFREHDCKGVIAKTYNRDHDQ